MIKLKVSLTKKQVDALSALGLRCGFKTRSATVRALIDVATSGALMHSAGPVSIDTEIRSMLADFGNHEPTPTTTAPPVRRLKTETIWRKIENTTD